MKLTFFIPEIKSINGTQVPSTPFTNNKNTHLFLGDVFECCCDELDDSAKEIYFTELKDGQYIGTTANPNRETPLWILDPNMINVLGSAVDNPDLLKLLSK